MLVAAGLFLILLLVIVHEYGHFLAAKRNGVEVEEFGIGFPPKMVGKTMGKGIFRSHYTINWLPLGGFVKLKGESDSDTAKGSFGASSFWVKTKIILAGVVMNFVAAFLIFTFLAFTGMPELVENQYSVESSRQVIRDDIVVLEVGEDSPAAKAGIRVGDSIESINDEELSEVEDLFGLTEKYAGQTVPVSIEKSGDEISVEVTFNDPDSTEGFLGVTPSPNKISLSKYGAASLQVGLGTTLQFSQLTYQGIASIFQNLFQGEFQEAGEQVSGPILLVVIINNISKFGIAYVLYLVGIISISLAVFNSLPIPALDGGRLFVSGMFKLFKKPLSKELEEKIHGTGFMALIGLMILITVVDVGKVF